MHMRNLDPVVSTNARGPNFEEAQARHFAESLDLLESVMRPINEQIGGVDEAMVEAHVPDLLDEEARIRTIEDPVWWLEHAIDEIKYERPEDEALVLKVLRRLRDDAWDCQTGKVDAEYRDRVAEARRYLEVYGLD